MKQFEIHYKGFRVINAESLEQANQMMADQEQFDTTVFVDLQERKSHEVIGHCELSGLAIFEGDNYEYDNYGVMWLKGKEVQA